MRKIISIVLLIIFLILGYKIVEISEDDKTNRDEYIKVDIGKNYENYEYINMGDTKNDVIKKIGTPNRVSVSEYGFDWYVYNKDYNKFAMVGIENGYVVALFSNSIDSCENEGINLDDNSSMVNEKFKPLEYILKGNTKYIINSNDEYDIVKENGKYITYFYDVIDDRKICSYQIISEKTENNKKDIYTNGSDELIESFELITIDLINSTRAKHNLSPMMYSERATISSRKHSLDMIKNKYFDHINKKGETPFDRMKDEDIQYMSAAENIASGQFSAIFAHEALMNSKGHRKNILGDYKNVGVGVDFGGEYKIYYTQNFYSE